ncbi:hypothetical protein KW803_00235 [Candidatus Saccharibacteria bacterium]|nr:hypothetical protein [Candidatus Saccharibacteria bacterium]
MRKKGIYWIIGATAAILAVPAVAMQLNDEVKWTGSDFVVMWVLLVGAGLLYEFLATRRKSRNYRIAVGVGVLVATLAIWVCLATG